ncbi:G-protein coupled receptor GRL101-like [Clytia hemisphaerica]|uniref:G-protein coupled receptor GRL101-like n=1 Tax=Clytia hemisphaerica TaxID=252671 RepID=UPI0034D61B0E
MSYQSILYKYVTLILGVLIMVFNSIMLIYIRKSKAHKHKPAGFVYVINMAVSDLFVGVVMVILKSMDPYIETTLANSDLAQFTNHVMRYWMVRFTLLVSVFNLVALTIDRLYAIRFPFDAQQMKRRFHIKVCCGVWLLSLVMTLLCYIFVTYCVKNSLRYKDAIFPIATIPATVLFVVSYTMIFTVVCRTSKTVKKIEASVRSQQAPQKIPKDKVSNQPLSIFQEDYHVENKVSTLHLLFRFQNKVKTHAYL